MKLRKVDPEKIQVPQTRVTARFNEEIWRQFQSSMKETGPIAPIICCEIDNELVLVDGLHRLMEAIQNKQLTIDVAVIPGDMVDVLTKNIFLDHLRGKTPVSEMVKVIGVLWQEFNLDSEKIAARTGMTRDYVEKLQAVSQLTPACLEALDEERIGVGHAYALTKLKDPIQQDTVLQQQLLYRWKVKELEEYIKTVLELLNAEPPPGPGGPERPPYKPKCVYCGEEFEITEVASPITCRYCSGILFAAIAQARAEAKSQPPPGEPRGEPPK